MTIFQLNVYIDESMHTYMDLWFIISSIEFGKLMNSKDMDKIPNE